MVTPVLTAKEVFYVMLNIVRYGISWIIYMIHPLLITLINQKDVRESETSRRGHRPL